MSHSEPEVHEEGAKPVQSLAAATPHFHLKQPWLQKISGNNPSWTGGVFCQLCHEREAEVENHRPWRGETRGDIKGSESGGGRRPFCPRVRGASPLWRQSAILAPARGAAEEGPSFPRSLRPQLGDASGGREGQGWPREEGSAVPGGVSVAAPLSCRCRFLRDACGLFFFKEQEAVWRYFFFFLIPPPLSWRGFCFLSAGVAGLRRECFLCVGVTGPPRKRWVLTCFMVGAGGGGGSFSLLPSPPALTPWRLPSPRLLVPERTGWGSGRPWGLLPAPLRSCWGAGARSRRQWAVAGLRRPPACPWRGAKRGATPGSCGTSYKRFNIAPNSPNLKWRPFASRQWCRASGDGKRDVWVAGTTSSVGMDTIWWSSPWDPPLAGFETARRRGGEASAGPCCSLGKMYLLGRRLEESCTLLGPGSPMGRTGSWGGCCSVYLLFNLDAAFLFIKTVLKHRCPLLRIYALKS